MSINTSEVIRHQPLSMVTKDMFPTSLEERGNRCVFGALLQIRFTVIPLKTERRHCLSHKHELIVF